LPKNDLSIFTPLNPSRLADSSALAPAPRYDHSARFVLSCGAAMTMHRWTAKHYFISAVIIIVAVGAFVYSWS
jgi:hypothetical protein